MRRRIAILSVALALFCVSGLVRAGELSTQQISGGEGSGPVQIMPIAPVPEDGAERPSVPAFDVGGEHLKGVIGDVVVRGNHPFVENRIKRYLTIRPGEQYDPSKVPEQIERIKAFYEREGFVDTEVSVDEMWEEAKEDIVLTFSITHGLQLRYGNIEVEGNNVIPRGRFISVINPYRMYNTRKLRESLHRMADIYHKKGYPRARVRIDDVRKDEVRGRVDLKILVNEGPYVETRFIGDKRLSRHSLKKAITIYTEGAYDDEELKASVRGIKKAYKIKGFPFAEATYAREDIDEDNIVITFTIDEGIRQRIRNIDFEGNENISGRRLRKQMSTKEVSLHHRGIYEKEALESDRKRLKWYYQGEGYLDTKIGDPVVATDEEWKQIEITVPIEEGPRTKVGQISFTGNESFRAKRLLKVMKLKPDEPFNKNILETEKTDLLLFYADNGHPYAEVAQKISIDDATATADIFYDLNEGPLVRIRSISIEGDTLTSQRAILHSMSIHQGDKFSYRDIMDSQIGLRRLGAFRSVKIEALGIEQRSEEIDLLVKVEEIKPLKVDFEVGYSTDMSATGTLDFVNLNTFGWGKRTGLRLTGGKKLDRAEMYWIDPRFTGHDLEFNTNMWLQYENRDVFRYVQAAGGVGLYRRYHRTSFFTRWELDRNHLLEGDSTAADAESLRNNTISRITLSMSFDTRDNFANPGHGIYTMGTTSIFNEIKGRDANFFKFSWLFGVYENFFKFMTLASEFRFDNIQTVGHNVSVPTNELLLMGGDDTVRGWGQGALGPKDAAGNPTGGRLRWIVNEELRFDLFKGFQLAGFFDMGSLTNDYDSVGWDTVKMAAGAGLRYITPVGPIRLDYGFKLNRDPGESLGRVHFTFGYIF